MIKAVIFDCFGVFYVDAQASLKDRFPNRRIELDDLRRQSDYGMISKQEYLQAVAQLTGMKGVEVERIVVSEHVINEPLLKFVKNELKGRYKVGILSNVGRGWLEDLFKKPQQEQLFDIIIASGEEGIAKPHPEIFHLVAERLGVEPNECIMVDDIEENCAGADAAGMKAILYKNFKDMKQELERLLTMK